MSIVTVGERYQIVIPKKERRALHIQPHSRMNVVAEGAVLRIYDMSPSSLKGIGKAIADGTDATSYIKSLRREWHKNV
jgi:AbrB family looped-hinge helix DNA binding protein